MGSFGVVEAEATKVLIPDCLYNRNIIKSCGHVLTFFVRNGIHLVHFIAVGSEHLSTETLPSVLPVMEQAVP